MKPPTAAQKRRWSKVVELGCLICDGPAEIHHCLHDCGMSQRDHDQVAPLCPGHHLVADGSRHKDPGAWSDKGLHLQTVYLLKE